MKFKKGGFAHMHPVKPVWVRIKYLGIVNPADEITSTWDILVIILSSFTWNIVQFHFMPVFTPTEYMFEKYAEKGSERWEIYAWCVRQAMIEAGGFVADDHLVREKLAY
jgi:hypothetical protein